MADASKVASNGPCYHKEVFGLIVVTDLRKSQTNPGTHVARIIALFSPIYPSLVYYSLLFGEKFGDRVYYALMHISV